MYRIEVQSTTSAPFSSFAEAQEAHVALASRAESFSAAEKVDASTARAAMVAIAQLRRDIRAFEWRLAATGAAIADAQQRSLAQSLLDFWALRHVELRERAWLYGQQIGERNRPQVRRPVAPRSLLPVDESLAESLAETAERLYQELPDDDARGRARELFIAIASPYAGNRTIDPEIATKFAAESVIVGSGGGARRYAFGHDSLATQWPRLAEWMEQARRDETEYELVAANARNLADGENDGSLPQGAALEQARKFAERDPAIADYVARADEALRRQLSYNRKVKFGLLLAIPLILAGAAFGGSLLNQEPSLSSGTFEAQIDEAFSVRDADNAEYAVEQQAIATTIQEPVTKTAGPVAAPIVCARAEDAHGYIWLGSAGNSQVTDTKGSPIEPREVNKGMPLIMGVWLNLRAKMPPGGGDNRAGPPIGTASARSWAVTTTDPKSVRVNGIDQYWVEVDLTGRVFIQVPPRGDGRIERLQRELEAAGLKVPAIQQLSMPGGLNEVRYYYKQDAARAEQVACLANRALAPDAINRVKVRSLVGTALAANVNNGTIELWLYPQQTPAIRPRGTR